MLIYNPLAGDGSFPQRLNEFVEFFQQDFTVSLLNFINIDVDNRLGNLNINDYSYILVAGGDGTVNSVATAMVENNISTPLGILPTGTSNDLAAYLGLPTDFYQYLQIVRRGKIKWADLGQINSSYFINVCAGGFLTNVPHQTDTFLKNRLGKIAYYLKGLQEFPSFKALPLNITVDNETINTELFMFLILNSNRAGGFEELITDSAIDDNLFEFIAIKYGSFYEMFNSLIDVFINKNLTKDNVLFHRGSYFKLEPQTNKFQDSTDIDGEKGPEYPVEIEVIANALPLLVR